MDNNGIRDCANPACDSQISGCNGFVKAGDHIEGRVPPRELCGRCALTVEWTSDGRLVPQDIAAINAELRALR